MPHCQRSGTEDKEAHARFIPLLFALHMPWGDFTLPFKLEHRGRLKKGSFEG